MPKNNMGAVIGFGVAFVIVAILSQFNIELGKGNVPIPNDWQWAVPIITAGIAAIITVVTPYFSPSQARESAKRP